MEPEGSPGEDDGKLVDGRLKGMRLIVRKERPRPGAQLRITDADAMRITCFATNTPDRPIAELELRHRLRARAEDRIRAARTTGLRHLPRHTAAQNKVWLEIVQIALDLLAWMPMLPSRARPDAGNPAACDSACSPRPPSASPPAGAGFSASPALALDRRDHHRPRTTRAAAHPRLTSNLPPSRAVEPGAPSRPAKCLRLSTAAAVRICAVEHSAESSTAHRQ